MRSNGNRPRVVLASGIFFPDVGGPATHVRHIADYLHALGWEVTVVAFGDCPPAEPYRVVRVSRHAPKLWSWTRYASSILIEARTADAVYAFDLTTAGVPSAIATRLFRIPFLLRIGGDPIWERVVEKGKRFIPMRMYYDRHLHRKDRPVLYHLLRWVVAAATQIVVYSEFIQDIYVRYYGIPRERIFLLRNPFRHIEHASLEQWSFTFMFAGRFVNYKNLLAVLRAFEGVAARHSHARLLLVGAGPEEEAIRNLAAGLGDRVRIEPPLDRDGLFRRIRGASVMLAPALTEFNPNFILESLSLGKPALISRDNGLSVLLPEDWQFDPLETDSIESVMERTLEPETYRRMLEVVEGLPDGESWETVVSTHAHLISSVIASKQT